MKMEPLKNGSLKIWMTDTDMQHWGLQFEQMGSHDEATRRAALRLIAVARDRRLLSTEGALTMEALPIRNGCLLLITPHRDPLLRLPPPATVYCFHAADDLLQLADSLRYIKAQTLPPASLFRWQSGYRLIVYHDATTHTVCRRQLCEYAEPLDGVLAVARTSEYGKAICIGDALSRLCLTAHATPPPTPTDPPH